MDVDELEAITAKVPLFEMLNPTELSVICSAMISRNYATGEMIVHEEDEENQTFFLIAQGAVNVTVLTTEGKQTILATLRRGGFFGEMSLLDGEPRSASVVAAEDCRLLILYRKTFLDILQRFPKIAVQMLIEMSLRLRKSNRHINTLSMMSVYGRVADVVLQLGKETGRKIGNMVIIENRPTHQMIADMAGTSRETVSRILSQLQKKQYLTMDRKKLVILNEEKLYY
jgi:CRP/FNR family transcriptional regulator/CRP/FNR family cyclic AMP-dependent transcriptional regulator